MLQHAHAPCVAMHVVLALRLSTEQLESTHTYVGVIWLGQFVLLTNAAFSYTCNYCSLKCNFCAGAGERLTDPCCWAGK